MEVVTRLATTWRRSASGRDDLPDEEYIELVRAELAPQRPWAWAWCGSVLVAVGVALLVMFAGTFENVAQNFASLFGLPSAAAIVLLVVGFSCGSMFGMVFHPGLSSSYAPRLTGGSWKC